MSKHDRDLLRKQLRAERGALSEEFIASKSLVICQKVEQLLADARHIAAYYAFGGEVDLSTLINGLSAEKKQAYVPVILPHFHMQFAPVDQSTPTTLNQFGIKEPQVDKSHLRDPMQLDAVLVPLVGFDEQCNRMGMGGGYYDRNFANRLESLPPPLLIGVAYDIQFVDAVHEQPWDVPLDYVVTETRLHKRI